MSPVSNGMRRIYSLRGPKDFQLLFRRGRRHEFPLFRVVIGPNRLDHARFAFVVPRISSKLATVRNRLRRRARELIRREPKALQAPYDMAITFKKEAAQASKKKFYEELKRAMAQVGL